MTLSQFEELCDNVFAERLPGLTNSDEDAEWLSSTVFPELERVALSSGLEVCERGAYLLVLARYDMHLYEHAEQLGVPADYFEANDRQKEEEAFAYLHERRCGAPARHAGLTSH
jgi:hypothetical protein